MLRPGGTLLIADLTSFGTSSSDCGWSRDEAGAPVFRIDRCLEERAQWLELHGLFLRNWHRPLGTYMRLLLHQGLILRGFVEPAPRGGDPASAERYRRVPWLLMMKWEKPGA